MNCTFQEFSKAYNEHFLPKLNVKMEYNICPKLDALVIGSDEVFNCTQPGNKVGFSRQLFGKNNNAGKVVSYAASFGSTTYEKLKQYHCKLRSNGMPVPLLRNCYSIFNGTKYC